MFLVLCVLRFIGGTAIVYTFAEVKNDPRGVERTLRRYEGLDSGRPVQSTEIKDCCIGLPEGERAPTAGEEWTLYGVFRELPSGILCTDWGLSDDHIFEQEDQEVYLNAVSVEPANAVASENERSRIGPRMGPFLSTDFRGAGVTSNAFRGLGMERFVG